MTDTTLADLKAQRLKLLGDIESSCESHGLPVAVINDLVTNRLPAIEAAIAELEAQQAATP
jgi:hypothetical protein